MHSMGNTFAYNRIPVLDTTIKLGPSTKPITNMFKTELHVCKQQHTPMANKMSFPCFSNTLVDMYMKLHKHLGFDGPM